MPTWLWDMAQTKGSTILLQKMLKSLEILSIKLLSNNPLKIKGLEENGILVQREQHEIPYRDDNFHYLKVKANRMGHILNLIDEYQ